MSELGDWEKYIAPWKGIELPPPPDGFVEKIKAEIQAILDDNKPKWVTEIDEAAALNVNKLQKAMEILKANDEIGKWQGFKFVETVEVSSEGYAKISNADIWWGKIGGGK